MDSANVEQAPGGERIDAQSDDEIRRWARILGVTNVAVLDAVQKVGTRVDDVRLYLDQAMAAGQADA